MSADGEDSEFQTQITDGCENEGPQNRKHTTAGRRPSQPLRARAMATHPSLMSQEIELLCWIFGDHPPASSRTFLVRVPRTATVWHLKQEIKKERKALEHLDLVDLDLYRVNLRPKRLKNIESLESDVKKKQLLDPHIILAEVFPQELRSKRIHIIACPPQWVVGEHFHPCMILYLLTGSSDSLGSIASSDNDLLQAALQLHSMMWKKPLAAILSDVRVGEENTFKYVSNENILRCLRRIQFQPDSLLIRPEYEIAYVEVGNTSSRNRHMIITGQPGIGESHFWSGLIGYRDGISGKTCFLFYALLRNLSNERPTALQILDDKFLLFTEKDVLVLSTSSSSRTKIPPFTWALADSSEKILQPCMAFLAIDADKQASIIQACSPKESRWKEWKKQHGARLFVMERYTPDEMKALG